MNTIKRALVLTPLLFLLTACPYESSVPITEANKGIDNRFLGKWIKEGEQDEEFPDEFYQIQALGDRLYEIEKNDFSSEDSTYRTETYISHFSTLTKSGEDFLFLNMKKDGKYYLHRVDLSDETFVLFEVTDNIDEQFSNSKDLKAFVEKNMDLSFFYNKDEATFYKGN